MAKKTQRSKRSKDGTKLNTSPASSQQVYNQAGMGRLRPLHRASACQKEQTPSNTESELIFHQNSSQHTQISKALFNQDQIGVATVGLDGRIQQANHALANLLLYKKEELAGCVLDGLVCDPERTVNNLREIGTQPDKHRASSVLGQLTRKSGETVPCVFDSHAIHTGDGKVNHFLVFVSDGRLGKNIDERSRFEKGFFQSQALQILGMLAGGVAHDFNNALEVIIGFASLARTRLSPVDPLYEPLKIIEESAIGAADLVRQLLDLSTEKSGDEGDIEVSDLINAVIAIVSRTFDRKIRIEQRINSRLPCIKGFHNRLKQAILNLCLNARDAMPQGGILTFEAKSERLAPADPRLPPPTLHGQYVRIAIRDTGTGMAPEIMGKIFVPLFTTKEPGQGSGLGLAMVERIVKEARGFISVDSKLGEGSEFSLYFPAVLRELTHATSSSSSQLIAGRGRVLVVDDEPRILEFLEKGLTRLGYDVLTAESGQQACKIYSRRCDEINCVLLDLIMPGMSGLDTYGKLQDINPRVKVILSSGYSSGRLRHEAVEAGSSEFLGKPYTLEDLSQALKKIQQN